MVFSSPHQHHSVHTDSSFAAETFSVPIYNNNNLQYYGQVDIGTSWKEKPGHPFNVIFDTGSTKLWVPSSACTSAVCKAHNQFDPESSSTYRTSPSVGPTSLTYGTGLVRVVNGTDVVTLSGHPVSDDPSTHPVAVAISESSKPFGNLKPIDGIYGMSPVTPIANKLFSIYLSNDTDRAGQLSVGSVDRSHATDSAIKWHPVKDPKSWNIELVDIKVGDERLGLCSPSAPCPSLVDSGSSLITGPSRDIAKLLQKIHSSCGDATGVSEPVSLILKDESGAEIEYPLSAREYSIDFRDTNECNLGFGPLDLGKKKWVIGDTFLRRYLSVFDKANNRVGFVRSKHADESVGVVTRALDEIVLKSLAGWTASNRHEKIQKLGNDFLFN